MTVMTPDGYRSGLVPTLVQPVRWHERLSLESIGRELEIRFPVPLHLIGDDPETEPTRLKFRTQSVTRCLTGPGGLHYLILSWRLSVGQRMD
jgi:hypothetical protein